MCKIAVATWSLNLENSFKQLGLEELECKMTSTIVSICFVSPRKWTNRMICLLFILAVIDWLGVAASTPLPHTILSSDANFTVTDDAPLMTFSAITINAGVIITITLCNNCSGATAVVVSNLTMGYDSRIIFRSQPPLPSFDAQHRTTSVVLNASNDLLGSVVFVGEIRSSTIEVSGSEFDCPNSTTFSNMSDGGCIVFVDLQLVDYSAAYITDNIIRSDNDSIAGGILFAGDVMVIDNSSLLLVARNDVNANFSMPIFISGPSLFQISLNSSVIFDSNTVNTISSSSHDGASAVFLCPSGNVSIVRVVNTSTLLMKSNHASSQTIDISVGQFYGISIGPSGDYESLLDINLMSGIVVVDNSLVSINSAISVGSDANHFANAQISASSRIILDNNSVSAYERAVGLEVWINQNQELDTRTTFRLSNGSTLSMSGNIISRAPDTYSVGIWVNNINNRPIEVNFIVDNVSRIIIANNIATPVAPTEFSSNGGVAVWVSGDNGKVIALFSRGSLLHIANNNFYNQGGADVAVYGSGSGSNEFSLVDSTLRIVGNSYTASFGISVTCWNYVNISRITLVNSSIEILENRFLSPTISEMIIVNSAGKLCSNFSFVNSMLKVEDNWSWNVTSLFALLALSANFTVDDATSFYICGNSLISSIAQSEIYLVNLSVSASTVGNFSWILENNLISLLPTTQCNTPASVLMIQTSRFIPVASMSLKRNFIDTQCWNTPYSPSLWFSSQFSSVAFNAVVRCNYFNKRLEGNESTWQGVLPTSSLRVDNSTCSYIGRMTQSLSISEVSNTIAAFDDALPPRPTDTRLDSSRTTVLPSASQEPTTTKMIKRLMLSRSSTVVLRDPSLEPSASTAIIVSTSFGLVLGALSSPSGALSLQRLSSLIRIRAACNANSDDNGQLEFTTSPTGLGFGSGTLRFYRGGVIGNFAFTLSFLCLIVSFTYITWLMKRESTAVPTTMSFQHLRTLASLPGSWWNFPVLALWEPSFFMTLSLLLRFHQEGNPGDAVVGIITVALELGMMVWIGVISIHYFDARYKIVSAAPQIQTSLLVRWKQFVFDPRGEWVAGNEKSFLRHHGGIFEAYVNHRQWFILVELIASIVFSFAEAVSDTWNLCNEMAIVLAVAISLMIVLQLALRPSNVLFDACLGVLSNAVAIVSCFSSVEFTNYIIAIQLVFTFLGFVAAVPKISRKLRELFGMIDTPETLDEQSVESQCSNRKVHVSLKLLVRLICRSQRMRGSKSLLE